MHPIRSDVNVNSFAIAGKNMQNESIFFECERKKINNESEIIFAGANSEFCMKLSDRERALLVLEKRGC